MTPRPVTDPPAPGTPEWRRMITASKVASMLRDAAGDYLGIGYNSAFELWHQMAGLWEPDGLDSRVLDRGHWMEASGREFWLYENPGWRISRKEVAYTDSDLQFPNLVTLDSRASRGRSRRIVEIKAPRKDQGVHDKWRAQVMFQMGVTGIHQADLVLMPQYGEERIEHIEWDPDLYAAIVDDAAHFWRLLEAGTPPDAGASEHAAQILAALHPTPDPDTAIELPVDVMDEWTTALDRSAAAEKALTTVENKVREQMGDAARASFDGRVVASRSAGRFAKTRLPKTDEAKAAVAACTVTKESLDTAALKRDHPDLYAAATAAPTYTFKRKDWS
ncbi:hypothetical protein [Corynebacterium sp.]|uniref:hypothetical protein n=1 Tax=Corynebacterium sp. TaxID=1720 RepID=UPI003B3B7536